ncbi:MAG: cation diffusion facilitator family transporter [Candidatus Limnocylindrales bacterium]
MQSTRPAEHRTTSAAHHHRRGLLGALLLSSAILVLELVAGLAGNSVALLADAGHVFADVSGMALAAGAVWIANRRASDERSFGMYRVEILAAGLNAVLLLAIAAVLVWEGIQRLVHPEDVQSGLMIVVAALALSLNLVAVALLRRGQKVSLTMRGAYLEVLGDALGAATVLVAGVVIGATGLRGADGLAAILIGLLILPRTWSLLRDSIDVLLEATPKNVDIADVRRHILDTPGVAAVHDLHAWTITSGMNVVSAHVVLNDGADPGRLIDHLSDCLAGDFDIGHSTFQLETPEHVLWEGRSARSQH